MDESHKSSLLTTGELCAAGRSFPGNFRLGIQVEGQTSEFLSRDVLRLIPGVRLVCRGEWSGRRVVAKLFLPQRGAERRIGREIRGIEALAAANIPVPSLLAHGTFADDPRARVLLFEEIQNAVSLRAEIHRLTGPAALYPLLERLVGLVAQQHRAGILQSDLHLDNFLLRGNTLFAIDGGTVARDRSGGEVPREAGLKNLALLLAQLPLSFTPLFADLHREYSLRCGWPCDTAARDFLDRSVHSCRERRLRIILAKTMRECSDFFRVRTRGLSSICRRKYDSNEMRNFLADPDEAIRRGKLLKDGRSTTVALVSIGGVDLVVKRYNIKTPRRVLRYLFYPTHARRSWINSHRLEALGIGHARAVAYAERRIGPMKRAAYFVAEYVSGTDARTIFARSQSSEHGSRDIVEQTMRLLDSLAAAHLSHGDLKASNIVFHENSPLLIDLDGMRHHSRSNQLHVAQRNDVVRLLQNFRGSSPLYRQLALAASKRIDSIGPSSKPSPSSNPVQFPQEIRRGRLRLWYRTDSPVPLVSQELLDVLEQSGTPDESRSEILKRDRRRSIFRISSGDKTVVIKSFPFATLKDMWRWNRYAPSEARNAFLAQQRGIPTPAYYGLFRTRRAGLVDNCGVILEDLKDYASLDERARRGKDELLRGVPILEMLYRAGVNHMDPSPFNLLIHRDSQQPIVLDWQYASFTEPRNEAQLVIQAAHFLDYAHIAPGEEFWHRWTDDLHCAARPAMPLARFQTSVQAAQGRRLRPRERARIVDEASRAA